jgi:hypothetical protein
MFMFLNSMAIFDHNVPMNTLPQAGLRGLNRPKSDFYQFRHRKEALTEDVGSARLAVSRRAVAFERSESR